jgi:hypothetical protein
MKGMKIDTVSPVRLAFLDACLHEKNSAAGAVYFIRHSCKLYVSKSIDNANGKDLKQFGGYGFIWLKIGKRSRRL